MKNIVFGMVPVALCLVCPASLTAKVFVLTTTERAYSSPIWYAPEK